MKQQLRQFNNSVWRLGATAARRRSTTVQTSTLVAVLTHVQEVRQYLLLVHLKSHKVPSNNLSKTTTSHVNGGTLLAPVRITLQCFGNAKGLLCTHLLDITIWWCIPPSITDATFTNILNNIYLFLQKLCISSSLLYQLLSHWSVCHVQKNIVIHNCSDLNVL